MAIRQISKIQHRQGLYESLPQLSGGELGWAIDSRRLFIGNGSLTDGAPVVGNTEVLTEFSDLLEIGSGYTYKGNHAGYTVKTGELTSTPINRTLQTKLDERASVLDFGAKGDGTTDDTDAINRAFNELFCRESNTEIRRALFFPAGKYKITSPLKIPSFAKILGDGLDSSIIQLDNDPTSTVAKFVARTTDSLQQTGSQIGSNNATLPTMIEIEGITFQALEVTDVFQIDRCDTITFRNVGFKGKAEDIDINDALDGTCCVKFDGSSSQIPKNITFDACSFSKATYGIDTGIKIQNVNIINSKFSTHFQALYIGATIANGGPQGFKVSGCLFDNIYNQGIYAVNASTIISSNNLFLDVGTDLNGGTATATSPIIQFDTDRNLSIGDMFERPDSELSTHERIKIGTTKSIGFDNGNELQLGQFVITAGQQVTLADNTSSSTNITTVNATDVNGFEVDYTIVRGSAERRGTFRCTSTSTVFFEDDFTENSSTGVTLSADINSGLVRFRFISTSTGTAATMRFTIKHLN